MIIDTSALLAILQDEPERRAFNEAIEESESRLVSAATLLETSMVIETRYGADGLRDLDLLISKASIEIVPFDHEQAQIGRRAFSQFGKGRHAAGLNYGECFSYALARTLDESLLFKGNDFAKTDLVPALPERRPRLPRM